MTTSKQKSGFSVKAYEGDAKTLLAFNLTKAKAKNLAGFTIHYRAGGQNPFYVQNNLRFKDPSKHTQDATQSPNSSLNAPIHKFRWVHVPGSLFQGTKPFYGRYTYTITPRYFDVNGSLLPIDSALDVPLPVQVGPFKKGKIEVGNTRGFIQSQAFVHHFGPKAVFRPKGRELLFDTSQISGTDPRGKTYTFAEQYEWLGFTARESIFATANEVLASKKLHLDVFAYDLNEPDLMKIFLKLANEGRIRMILDDAALHHASADPKPEDRFQALFEQQAKAPAEILRGKFGRYAHDKVLIVSKISGSTKTPMKVLTGSTNFSVTGFYVNSNHILLFNDSNVAATYQQVFDVVWGGKVSVKFNATPEAANTFSFPTAANPATEITFSPHKEGDAKKILDGIAARIAAEQKQKGGSVLFAVMGLTEGTGPILPALRDLHSSQEIFSYGISDSPGGIYLYTRRRKTGVLVSGKPAKTKLPPPFDQVPNIGLGHQVHHKFVVCGFNGKNPVAYCGSSNLTQKGEEVNGDNLIAIQDADIATVFAIEALALVDHFDFLNRSAEKAGTTPVKVKGASKEQQAANAGWFLSTSDRWVGPYFDTHDLHSVDRELFA